MRRFLSVELRQRQHKEGRIGLGIRGVQPSARMDAAQGTFIRNFSASQISMHALPVHSQSCAIAGWSALAALAVAFRNDSQGSLSHYSVLW
jgi:hypothetical protein